jgi:UDPglucose 6-dehydrogenase
VVVTDTSTAELIKHAANAFLSTKISYINMVSDLCEKVGADVTAVARGLGLDNRIGRQFLDAGIGYGGYCFPKDLRAFIYLAEEHGVDFSLLREVERVNQQRVEVFVKKVRQALWVLRGKTLGILGLAFKAGTDDIREAVSLKIIKALLEEGSVLQMYDPQAMPNTQRVFPETAGQLTYCNSAYDAVRGGHALLLLTEWPEFRDLDLARLRSLMEVPLLVDGRNLFDPGAVRQAGFEYFSMGREGVGVAVDPSKGNKHVKLPG